MKMAVYTVQQIGDMLKKVCLDSRINKVILFGSHAKGSACETSDIDLYLDSGGQITGFDFFALKTQIEDAFLCEVDLLPDLDILPNSPIEREIKRHGVIVYGR